MSPTWIRTRVRHYAAFVGLGYVPKVVLSEKDWRKAVPKKQWRMAVGGNLAGCCWDNVVFVNRANACCRRNIDDTAAHEIVHLRWPNLRHGPKYTHYVKEIQLGRMPE